MQTTIITVSLLVVALFAVIYFYRRAQNARDELAKKQMEKFAETICHVEHPGEPAEIRPLELLKQACVSRGFAIIESRHGYALAAITQMSRQKDPTKRVPAVIHHWDSLGRVVMAEFVGYGEESNIYKVVNQYTFDKFGRYTGMVQHIYTRSEGEKLFRTHKFVYAGDPPHNTYSGEEKVFGY